VLRKDNLAKGRFEISTPIERYNQRVEEINKKYAAELDGAKELLLRGQGDCEHDFELHPALFYVLGETYPGMKCEICGAQKRV
jgi:hypothetical protein